MNRRGSVGLRRSRVVLKNSRLCLSSGSLSGGFQCCNLRVKKEEKGKIPSSEFNSQKKVSLVLHGRSLSLISFIYGVWKNGRTYIKNNRNISGPQTFHNLPKTSRVFSLTQVYNNTWFTEFHPFSLISKDDSETSWNGFKIEWIRIRNRVTNNRDWKVGLLKTVSNFSLNYLKSCW